MKDSSTVKNSLLFSADFAAHAFYRWAHKISGSDMRIKKKSIFSLRWEVFFSFFVVLWGRETEKGDNFMIEIIMLLFGRAKRKKKSFDNHFMPFNFQYEYLKFLSFFLLLCFVRFIEELKRMFGGKMYRSRWWIFEMEFSRIFHHFFAVGGFIEDVYSFRDKSLFY